MNTDPIADMLTRIRNAYVRKIKAVEMPYSIEKENVAKVLEKYGFIKKVSPFKNKGEFYKSLSIELSYDENEFPSVSNIERISKPSLRKYVKSREIKPVLNNIGIYVISTSRGIMSSVDAKKKKLGGEVVCKVY